MIPITVVIDLRPDGAIRRIIAVTGCVSYTKAYHLGGIAKPVSAELSSGVQDGQLTGCTISRCHYRMLQVPRDNPISARTPVQYRAVRKGHDGLRRVRRGSAMDGFRPNLPKRERQTTKTFTYQQRLLSSTIKAMS